MTQRAAKEATEPEVPDYERALQSKKVRLTVHVQEELLKPFEAWAKERYPGTRDPVARGVGDLLARFYRENVMVAKSQE